MITAETAIQRSELFTDNRPEKNASDKVCHPDWYDRCLENLFLPQTQAGQGRNTSEMLAIQYKYFKRVKFWRRDKTVLWVKKGYK